MAYKFLTIVLLSINLTIFVNGQNAKVKDSLTVKVVLNNIVKSNSDLQAKIIVKNISNIPVTVYKDLQWGIQFAFDRTNFVLILQVKKGDRFVENTRSSRIDFYPSEDSLDDKEKIVLVPHDSIVYFFHVDEISGFKAGSHRLRVLYSNQFHSIKGIPSNWVYFQVLHEIYAKHDY